MVTTSILVVDSERHKFTPTEIFENLILLKMITKYVYWVINSITGFWKKLLTPCQHVHCRKYFKKAKFCFEKLVLNFLGAKRQEKSKVLWNGKKVEIDQNLYLELIAICIHSLTLKTSVIDFILKFLEAR